jgi:hypothetical protein
LPHLAELSETFADRPVSIVSVLESSMTPRVETLIADLDVGNVVYTDESGDARDAYDLTAVPTTVIIDDVGRLMFRHVGFEEGMEQQFAREIEALLAWRTQS